MDEDQIKKRVKAQIKAVIKGSFQNIRESKHMIKVGDDALNKMLFSLNKTGKLTRKQQRSKSLAKAGHLKHQSNDEKEYETDNLNQILDSSNYRYSFEYLRNLREKYLILKEKLSKQQKQVHERKLDLSEFTLKISKFEKLISEEMRQEMKDFAFQSEADSSFEVSSNSSFDGMQSTKTKKKERVGSSKMSIWEKISKRNEEADAKAPSIPFNQNSRSCKQSVFRVRFNKVQRKWKPFLRVLAR